MWIDVPHGSPLNAIANRRGGSWLLAVAASDASEEALGNSVGMAGRIVESVEARADMGSEVATMGKSSNDGQIIKRAAGAG